MEQYSFQKGWSQVLYRDAMTVRQEIINALGLKHPNSFYPRLHGKIEPRVTDVQAIEAVFAKYGITEVWGTV